MPLFSVSIHYSGTSTFLVETTDAQRAEEIATRRYRDGEDGDNTVMDTEDIVEVDVTEEKGR